MLKYILIGIIVILLIVVVVFLVQRRGDETAEVEPTPVAEVTEPVDESETGETGEVDTEVGGGVPGDSEGEVVPETEEETGEAESPVDESGGEETETPLDEAGGEGVEPPVDETGGEEAEIPVDETVGEEAEMPIDETGDAESESPVVEEGGEGIDLVADGDEDGDQVINSADHCPYEVGPAPYGCPSTFSSYLDYPVFKVCTVNRNQNVTIQTLNLPPNQEFVALMGPMGTAGIGGTQVGNFNSGSGGSMRLTFDVPRNGAKSSTNRRASFHRTSLSIFCLQLVL